MESSNKDVNTTREQPHIPSDHEDYVDVTEEDLSNMRMDGNNAYNVASAVRPTKQGATLRPREPQVYVNPSGQFYEEIPARVETHQQPIVKTREAKPVPTNTISSGKALFSFWQGKVEIAIRIAILVVSHILL